MYRYCVSNESISTFVIYTHTCITVRHLSPDTHIEYRVHVALCTLHKAVPAICIVNRDMIPQSLMYGGHDGYTNDTLMKVVDQGHNVLRFR